MYSMLPSANILIVNLALETRLKMLSVLNNADDKI